MSNAHSPAACTATNCERIHVGNAVQVVVYGLGFMQYGNVIAISPLGAISVNFPDGVANVDEFAMEATSDLHFLESELENMSA